MSANPLHKALYLTGPTACGKTSVGVHLARRIGAEVIALDSMTLYKGMDIGTAKPSVDERGGIAHHLIDVLDPWQSASVADYRCLALAAAREIEGRGKRVLFVGGTALYLKALLRGLFEGPSADPAVRERLEREAAERGPAALHARLSVIDLPTAERLHPNDRRRIVRALEVIELTGRTLSSLQVEHGSPARSGTHVFALERPRADLHDRINRRVVAMFEAGLVDEVRRLQAGPWPIGPVAAQGVGYQEVIAMLEGRLDRDALLALVQTRTRQFAKRQSTWFRGLAEVQARPITAEESPAEIADRLALEVEESQSKPKT